MSWDMGGDNVVEAIWDWSWPDLTMLVRNPNEKRIAAWLYKKSRKRLREYPEWRIPEDMDDTGPPPLHVVDGRTGNRRTFIPNRKDWGAWKDDRRYREE
tara:strand:- start:308 stop:604 length:297 start_codon:yes stop_codon:yes gene_type:complete